MKTLLILAIVLLNVTLIPCGLIWCANTLFPVLAIPYSIETFLAIALTRLLLTFKLELS